jgi:hypothetical protein
MTIISLEKRVTQLDVAFKFVRVDHVTLGDSIRTVPTSAPLGIVPPRPESTTLVRDFILSFKELENYK